MPAERLSMIGARMSRALDVAAKMAPTKDEVINLMYEYEYLDQVPQPYRDMLHQADQYLRGETNTFPTSPMPSFKQSPEEIGALYASAAEAKGVTNSALAVKARVRPALIVSFYAGETIPTPARIKIKKALQTFGIDFGV